MKNTVFDSVNRDKLNRMLEIKHLYEQNKISLEDAQTLMRNEVGRITAAEFAAAEQLLKDEDEDECRNEDVRKMLSVFDGMIDTDLPELPYGHPLDAYIRENKEARKWLEKGDELLKQKFIKNPWIEVMEVIDSYKIHYSRKQNQLYSSLERHGFDRPSTTMWTYDDYIRTHVRKVIAIVNAGEEDKLPAAYAEMKDYMLDLMEKEELILYPTSYQLISKEEFDEMQYGDREIGFFRIDMPELAPKQRNKTPKNPDLDTAPIGGFLGELAGLLGKYGYGSGSDSNSNASFDPKRTILHVAEGQLTLEQINLLFKHLPVDISYVDEEEIVKFYTDTPHRVFPRSAGVIGREVRNCHPPKSVHIVEEIIEKFRTGEKDRIDFWINKPDLFIYILYVAVRDENGRFRGVMEMMQDCTHIRSLTDSRTLLVWDNENKDEENNKSEKNEEKKEPQSANSITEVTPETHMKDLFEAYPGLKDHLIAYNTKFRMLKTPMAKIMLAKATIKVAAERSGSPLNELIEKIKEFIQK